MSASFVYQQTRGELKGRISCRRPHLTTEISFQEMPVPSPHGATEVHVAETLLAAELPQEIFASIHDELWEHRVCSWAEAHRQKLITVTSILGEREMRYSALWSRSEEAHTEQFGEDLMIPMIKKRKGREAISDPQVCVVSQSSPWCLWQDDGSDVNLKNKKWRKQEIWKIKTVGHGEGKEPKRLRGHQTS